MSSAAPNTCYEVQSLHRGEWSSDVALLGGGLDQAANRWSTQCQAAAVMADLQALWPDASLRVATVDALPC